MKNVTAATHGCINAHTTAKLYSLLWEKGYELILNYLKCSNYFILLQ